MILKVLENVKEKVYTVAIHVDIRLVRACWLICLQLWHNLIFFITDKFFNDQNNIVLNTWEAAFFSDPNHA